MTNPCTLYIVRHGETEANKNKIVMGHLDAPLTALGVEQATARAEELKNIQFDAIFSSDSLRAQRTAEIIKLERQLAITTSQALRERSFGQWEGKSADEYKKNFQHLFATLTTLSAEGQKNLKLADDIESDEEMIGRFITQLREIAVAYQGKTVLVATHGGCIRTFLMHIGYVKYGQLPAGTFSNAGYAKVLSDGVDFRAEEVVGATIKQ